MLESQKREIEDHLQEKIVSFRINGGGVGGQTGLLFSEKRKYFFKGQKSPSSQYLTESQGLETLGQVVSTPQVYFKNEYCLLLEHIDSGHPKEEDFETLAQDVHRMHQVKSAQFGNEVNNFLGSTPQKNSWKKDWATFFWENRLLFLAELIQEKLPEGPDWTEKLLKKKNELFEFLHPHKEAQLSHGDLWQGNAFFSKNKDWYFIDPAIAFGDGWADIAMAKLFGGFSAAFFRTYEEITSSSSYSSKRILIYQLYHYLNHYYIFGQSYLPSCFNVYDQL